MIAKVAGGLRIMKFWFMGDVSSLASVSTMLSSGNSQSYLVTSQCSLAHDSLCSTIAHLYCMILHCVGYIGWSVYAIVTIAISQSNIVKCRLNSVSVSIYYICFLLVSIMVLEKDKIKVVNIRIDIILFTLVQNIVCSPGGVNCSAK